MKKELTIQLFNRFNEIVPVDIDIKPICFINKMETFNIRLPANNDPYHANKVRLIIETGK